MSKARTINALLDLCAMQKQELYEQQTKLSQALKGPNVQYNELLTKHEQLKLAHSQLLEEVKQARMVLTALKGFVPFETPQELVDGVAKLTKPEAAQPESAEPEPKTNTAPGTVPGGGGAGVEIRNLYLKTKRAGEKRIRERLFEAYRSGQTKVEEQDRIFNPSYFQAAKNEQDKTQG